MSAEVGPPYPDVRVKFRLPSGRLVWVTSFAYSETYAGLMDGWPREQLTNETIERFIVTAAKRMVPTAPVYLIPPTMEPVPHQVLEEYERSIRGLHRLLSRPPAPVLPPVQCLAQLESESTTAGHDGSHLKVAWFQKPFFDRPLSIVLADALRDIPWEAKAGNFDY